MTVTQKPPESHGGETGAFNRQLLVDLMEAKGLSRPVDAAKAFGMYRTDIYRLLEGQVPKLHRGLKIGRVLGIDPLNIWPEGCEADE